MSKSIFNSFILFIFIIQNVNFKIYAQEIDIQSEEEVRASESLENLPPLFESEPLTESENIKEVQRKIHDFQEYETENGKVTELICDFDFFIWTSEGYNGYSVQVFDENTNINVTWHEDLDENPRWYSCSSIKPKYDETGLVSNSSYSGKLITYSLHKIWHEDSQSNTVRITVVNEYVYFPCDPWYLKTDPVTKLVEKSYYPQKPDRILPIYFSYFTQDTHEMNITEKCDTPDKRIFYKLKMGGDDLKPFVIYEYESEKKSKLVSIMTGEQGKASFSAFWFIFIVSIVGVLSYKGGLMGLQFSEDLSLTLS